MKTHLNIYLSPGQHEEIAALSAKRRVSKSSVIEAAVASMLSPDSADMREAAFVRRLDRHTRQLERVERDLAIAIETIALFVRFWLAVTPPLPESAQAAAKAKGAERYRDLVETLGRRLQRGNSLVREISLEIWPEQRSNGVGSAVPSDPDLGMGDIADARRAGAVLPLDPDAAHRARAGHWRLSRGSGHRRGHAQPGWAAMDRSAEFRARRHRPAHFRRRWRADRAARRPPRRGRSACRKPASLGRAARDG